jgi:hypothetical protein
MGTNISFVLELLAGTNDLDACDVVVVQSAVVAHLAGKWAADFSD